MRLPILSWVVYKTPCLTTLSVEQFLTQNGMPRHALSPLFTLSPPKGLFVVVVLLDEKVLKRKCFADVEEVKQKMAKALKGIQINEFKNRFEQ